MADSPAKRSVFYVETFDTRSLGFYWRLKARNREILATSDCEHEAKEPRPGSTREEFEVALGSFADTLELWVIFREDKKIGAEVRPVLKRKLGELRAAFDSLAAARDEWKRRAEALGYQGGK